MSPLVPVPTPGLLSTSVLLLQHTPLGKQQTQSPGDGDRMAPGTDLLPNLPTAPPASLALPQDRVIKQHHSQGPGTETAQPPSAAQQHEICLYIVVSGDKKQAISEKIITPCSAGTIPPPAKPRCAQHSAGSEGFLPCSGAEQSPGVLAHPKETKSLLQEDPPLLWASDHSTSEPPNCLEGTKRHRPAPRLQHPWPGLFIPKPLPDLLQEKAGKRQRRAMRAFPSMPGCSRGCVPGPGAGCSPCPSPHGPRSLSRRRAAGAPPEGQGPPPAVTPALSFLIAAVSS